VWEVVLAGRLGPWVQEESPCWRCSTRYPVSLVALSCQERLMEVSVVAVTWRFVAAGGATPSVVTEMGPAAAVPPGPVASTWTKYSVSGCRPEMV
jgi:hypothetical protein